MSPPAYPSPAKDRSDVNDSASVQQPPSRPTTPGADMQAADGPGPGPGPSLQQPMTRGEVTGGNQPEQQPGPARPAAAPQEASTSTSVEEAAPVLAAAPMRPPPRAPPPRLGFPCHTTMVLFAPPPVSQFHARNVVLRGMSWSKEVCTGLKYRLG